METVFLDTGYILALEIANDQNHNKAKIHWQSVAHSLPQFVTSSYVFNETITFFNNRGYHSKSLQVGQRLLNSRSIQFIHIDKILFYEAWEYLQIHDDKTYSLTDCMSFVIMKKLQIQKAFTFDNHFLQAGFIKKPR